MKVHRREKQYSTVYVHFLFLHNKLPHIQQFKINTIIFFTILDKGSGTSYLGLCSESHETTIKMLAKLHSHWEARLWKDLLTISFRLLTELIYLLAFNQKLPPHLTGFPQSLAMLSTYTIKFTNCHLQMKMQPDWYVFCSLVRSKQIIQVSHAQTPDSQIL